MEPPGTLLNPLQRRIVGAGATAIAVAVLLAAAYGTFEVLRWFVATFSSVLLPLVAAAILDTLLTPLMHWLEARTRLKRAGTIAVIFAIVLLGITPIAMLLGFQLWEQGTNLFSVLRENITAWGEHIADSETLDEIVNFLGNKNFESLANDLTSSARSGLTAGLDALGSASSGILGFFGQAAMWLVLPVYLIFLLYTDEENLPRLAKNLTFVPMRYRDDILYLVRQFSDILIAYFRGQVVIAVLTGIILAIGFSIVGLKFGLFIGFAAGLANLIPYLGTTAGVLTILPLAYFQGDGGNWGLLILVSLVFAGAQFVQDYILTPRVMGKRTGLGPMTIIFSIFFWGVALGGISGVILAIPLTAFFTVFWRLAKKKYLPRFDDEADAADEAETTG